MTKWRENNRDLARKYSREHYHRQAALKRAAGDKPLNPKDRFAKARALGYRSGLEVQASGEFVSNNCEVLYEGFYIPWIPEPRVSKYKPDYFILHNGIVVETKGRWVTADRKKIKAVVKQHPDIDLRFVFANAHARISKQSKTTYAAFCDTLGIPWAHRHVPVTWMKEKVNTKSLAAVKRLMEEQTKK